MILRKTAVIVFFALTTLLLSSFYFVKEAIANQTAINDNYKGLLTELSLANDKFYKTINQSSFNSHEILTDYHALRKAYKKSSFLSFYLEKEFTLKNINGAPLPHLEKKAPEINVLQPKGFQVLDELLHEETLEEEVIKNVASILHKDLKTLIQHQINTNISTRQLLEALRQGLIEITSLGITGFDTPGSLSGVNESHDVLLGMKQMISQTAMEGTKFEKLLQSSLSKSEIKTSDFNSFDRYTFIREVINPMYENLVQYHEKSNFPFFEEVFNTQTPINYHSESIFESDFLNTNYYTSLDDSEKPDSLERLGEYLFFDPILSENNKNSCASCHLPSKAFSDGLEVGKAVGDEGNLSRNTPGLINSVYADRFFYDLRSNRLSGQFEHVIYSPKEFNTTKIKIIDRLNKSNEYKRLFDLSFTGNLKGKINSETISTALESYIQSLVALDSRFDKSMKGDLKLTQDEIKGFNIFTGEAACATCHFLPTFSGNVPPLFKESESEVLGVPEDLKYSTLDDDLGRSASGVITEESEIYNHSFKTVTVRNVENTAPYMHNGVFKTLEEVMEFYNNGGGVGHGLEVPNQTLAGDSLNLSEKKIDQVILFLKSLTSHKEFKAPLRLPVVDQDKVLDKRKVGGEY